jgi:hypothetical protein
METRARELEDRGDYVEVEELRQQVVRGRGKMQNPEYPDTL